MTAPALTAPQNIAPMPPATAAIPPAPFAFMVANTLMIPITVPKRPTNGAAEAMVANYQAEIAIYQDTLNLIQELAQLGNKTHHLGYFQEINQKATLAKNANYTQAGAQKLLFDYQVNQRWLGRAKINLAAIQELAAALDVAENSPNAEIKNDILKNAEAGLIFP